MYLGSERTPHRAYPRPRNNVPGRQQRPPDTKSSSGASVLLLLFSTERCSKQTQGRRKYRQELWSPCQNHILSRAPLVRCLFTEGADIVLMDRRGGVSLARRPFAAPHPPPSPVHRAPEQRVLNWTGNVECDTLLVLEHVLTNPLGGCQEPWVLGERSHRKEPTVEN